MDVSQSAAFLSGLTYESMVGPEYEDFPRTEEPVYILGNQYSALYDLEELRHDVLSRLWFTYRKGFSPIGGTGPSYDTGWGCMLRCGQMLLAQALVNRHLGRDWRWNPDKYDPKYQEILRLFQDKRGSCYSIHQIASMGVSEGKAIGQWFGPNTVAQVLKKLAVYDDWSSMVIHVALDNTIIIEDIYKLCQPQQQVKTSEGATSSIHCSPGCVKHRHKCLANGLANSQNTNGPVLKSDKCDAASHSSVHWKPLLLIIPLRLGLSEINPVYLNSLKVCFTLKQSVGVIGGKPNHAHWFIGYFGNELVYLDPHTTQLVSDVSSPQEMDESHHCPFSSRMKISQLDPSIALGFYCGTEEEFLDWCNTIRKFIIHGQKTPIFELQQKRPLHWPAFEPLTKPTTFSQDYTLVDSDERQYDSDEFELL